MREPRRSSDMPDRVDAPNESDGPILNVSWWALIAFTTKKHVPLLLCAILASLGDGIVTPISTIFVGRIFQGFTDFGSTTIDEAAFRSAINVNVIALLALAFAGTILSASFFSLWMGFGELQARTARIQVFNGLQAKPLSFYDTLPTGVHALNPRIQTQIRELQLANSQPLGSSIQLLASTLASLIIALRYSWSLTLLLLVAMPFNGLILSYISGRMQKHVETQNLQLMLAAKHASAALSNIETVKCYKGQETEFVRFWECVKSAAICYARQVRGNALQMGYMKFATFVTFMGGFYYGSHLVTTGKSSTADVITTFFSCLDVMQAIQEILPHMIVLEKGRAAGTVLRRLIEIAKHEHCLLSGGAVIPEELPGEIIFNNVFFSYPTRPHHPVLRGMSCAFIMGEMSFIIGRSGSGKSTLSHLLLRLYELDSGGIFFDNMSLSTIDPHWLRSRLTLIEQQNVLFEGTLFENIAVGMQDSAETTVEDVTRAAEFALLATTIRDMPQGLDTLVSVGGKSLSGGQRQRVALARARLRDSPILILDEPTSALDQTSKFLMMSAIRRWRQNKTTIFITHDLSLIGGNDHVVLLEEGRIGATGTRAQLEKEQNTAFKRYLRTSEVAESAQDSSGERKSGAVMTVDPKRIRSYHLVSPVLDIEEVNVSEDSGIPAGRRRYSFFPAAHNQGVAQEPGIFTTSSRSHVLYSPGTHSENARQAAFGSSLSSNGSPKVPRPITPKHGKQYKHFVTSGLTPSMLDKLPALEAIEMDILEGASSNVLGNRNFVGSWGPEPLSQAPKTSSNCSIGSKEALLDEWLQNSNDNHLAYKPSLRVIVGTVWPALDSKSRRVLVLSFICLLVHSAAIPLFSWIFSKLIGTFYAEDHAAQMALKWSMAMLALSFVDGIATYLLHVGLEHCSQIWVDHIRLQAMRRILDQPQQFFTKEENSAANLVYNLDRNAEEMRNILGRFLAFFIVAFVMLIIALVWSLIVCWRLALVGFCLTPLSWVLMQVFHRVSSVMEGQSNDAAEATARVLGDLISNLKILRAWNLERLFRQKHTKSTKRTLRVGIKRSLYSGFFFGISESSLAFISCLVYFYGGRLAASQNCSVQDVILVLSQLIFALGNVTAIMALIPQIASSKDTATRLIQLANLPQDSHEHTGAIEPLVIGKIRFNNVSFSHTNNAQDQSLRDVSLAFDTGTSTALVGPSGSGKTTIISLLLRLFPVTPSPKSTNGHSGITIDGTSLHHISTPHLRSLIAIVPQTPVLFPTTIAENIAYALPSNSPFRKREAIRAAASAAGIHDFIYGLPAGYDTLVGDAGIGLSGGQAQRLALARALVRQPQCLILDECTSALDGESARLVRETIKRLMRERPTMIVVFITHDRDMMELSDRVVVLDKGRVVEEGEFEELMDRGGRLASLMAGGRWMG